MAKRTAQSNPSAQRVPLQLQQVTQSFTGPLPHPDTLRKYNDIVPDAALRILGMAEEESKHRHAIERLATEANVASQEKQIEIAIIQTNKTYRSDMLGQVFGVMVSLFSIGGSIYLAINNQSWVAVALVGLPLAGVIRSLRGNPSKTMTNN